MNTLDHIGIKTVDFKIAKAFYEKALAPLDIVPIMVMEEDYFSGVGFGRDGKPDFWVSTGPSATSPIHICFAARSSHEVDAFYAAALAAGAKDNGAPGIRKEYHPGYYGAFVLDPDGHNLEAVFHGGISA